jgi:hypothetical protein
MLARFHSFASGIALRTQRKRVATVDPGHLSPSLETRMQPSVCASPEQEGLFLMQHVDGFLGDGIECGHCLRVRLKGALRDDQI